MDKGSLTIDQILETTALAKGKPLTQQEAGALVCVLETIFYGQPLHKNNIYCVMGLVPHPSSSESLLDTEALQKATIVDLRNGLTSIAQKANDLLKEDE